MKQALILGLGQFGSALARALTERGVEVLAVDRDERLVQQASSYTSFAAAFDANDEAALSSIEPQKRDFSVVAIGHNARDSSIICTSLLRQLGAPRVIARYIDDLHGRILKLVGAHEIVNPELEFGERLATRISFGVLEQVPLGGDLFISELRVPAKLVGRTLLDTDLPRKYGVTVVAIRTEELGRARVMLPNPNVALKEQDILVIAASSGGLRKLIEQFQ
ncbi:MAG: TrkA family potassium uptake protein [Deltaproteobacteria bacterium]|nr:TrkA family potassium uptake protein [Deltaproteobacteria bacterium]